MSSPPGDPAHASSASRPRTLAAYASIAATVALLALAFAWTRGWVGGTRVTAARLVDAIEANGAPPPGIRRAHGKGVCVSGYFEGNGRGSALSSARVFRTGRVPAFGRMSIGGGPSAPDGGARVRSMALVLAAGDGEEWRMAMNSFPVMAVATPEAFYAQTVASRPDPATGKPDPARQEAFFAAHPETAAFRAWARDAPWPTSYANTAYHGVNAFRFIDDGGRVRHVRWTMEPQAAFAAMDAQARERADRDFLARDLETRLREGPLRWTLRVTVAADGDPVTDPTRAWPAGRKRIDVGTLVLERAQAQNDGACRDVNFDPTILPQGIALSDDPILAARASAYAVSFNRRLREVAGGAGVAR